MPDLEHSVQSNALRTHTHNDLIRSHIDAMDSFSWSAAIGSGDFEVLLQPIVDIDNLQLSRFEGLVRWQHPQFGELKPSQFLAHMVCCARAHELTSFVLEKVAQFQVRAQFRQLEIKPISVNVTGTEFQDGERLFDTVTQVIQRHSLPLGAIALEMTETEWIENTAAAAFNISNLRKFGVFTYADDFGHAYASLRYLLDFSYSGLKMDRSFVLALTDDDRAKILIRNTAALAKELNLNFVVEGIESAEQLKILRELGVTHGQGYLFDRPLSMEQAYLRLKNAALV